MDSDEYPRLAAAAAAAERAGAQGKRCGRQGPHDAGTHGAAPRQPALRRLPSADGSVGFSLENFDAVGRWRVTEGDDAIDASGNLPDGAEFKGVAGLKKALLSKPELFVNTVTEKLLIYALGRGLEPYDGAVVRKIMRDAKSNDYRFSSLILGIVNSTPFQMRSSQ